MFEKIANIITAILIAAFGLGMIFSGEGRVFAQGAGFALITLIAHLGFVRFKTGRLWGPPLPRPYCPAAAGLKVDTVCLLRPNLTFFFNEKLLDLLKGLVGQGWVDFVDIRPRLGILAIRVRRLGRRRPTDPAGAAVLAWASALLAQGTFGRRSDRLWSEAWDQYSRAFSLNSGAVDILCDWSRSLGRAGELSEEDRRLDYQREAVRVIQKALRLDPVSPVARREAAMALTRLALWTDNEHEAQECLGLAGDSLEKSRPVWNHDFYRNFCDLLPELPEVQGEAEAFWRAAESVCALAAESANAQYQKYAALARYRLAGFEKEPEAKLKCYQAALKSFSLIIENDPDEADSRLWAARCLVDIYILEGRQGDETLLKALDHYLAAAHLRPEAETFFQWANFLIVLAEKEDGGLAARLWGEAVGKLKSAAALAPKTRPNAAIWHNWGYVLFRQAQTRLSTDGRRKALREAEQRYSLAARLDPSMAVTWLNRGDVMFELAELTANDDEAGTLFRRAEGFYSRAARLEPLSAEAWRRQALSLMGAAHRLPKMSRNIERLKCIVKLEQAARLDGRSAQTWALWGEALMEQSLDEPREFRLEGLAEAEKKLTLALKLAPLDAPILALMGRVRMEMADVEEDNALELACLATKNFQAAAAAEPQKALYWDDWGYALLKAAECSDNESLILDWLKEASEKFRMAHSLEPEAADHQMGLGLALCHLGLNSPDPIEKRQRLLQAYDHYRRASQLEPYGAEVWRHWGLVIESLALLETDPSQIARWQREADEKHFMATGLELPGGHDPRH